MASGAELLYARVKEATAGEYTLEGELGRGGMAAVYLARDLSLERRVAIKVMLPDLSEVEGIQERFVSEARTAAHLDHPGIVTVYSVKQREGLLFIVMKFIDGRTLESILAEQKDLDLTIIATIISQVAEALHFAHGEGVVHRDVKPSNILIDKRGRPVVTDFGIAKVTAARSITMTGAVLGTPAYMSPEQCRGLPATTASDQYSLGIMAYEMLAGQIPFNGTLFELIHAHCNEEPPPLAESAKGAGKVVIETVMRMLAKNPRERFPSLSEVATHFTQAIATNKRVSGARAAIAALAQASDATRPMIRRGRAAIDLSGAATEVSTTPAPALVITPAEPAIEVGETLQLRITESSGASLPNVRIEWRSEDATVATVDETGVVTGKGVGLAKITASTGTSLGRAAVSVKAPRVDTVVVTPQSPEIVAENELQLVATVLDARGSAVPGPSVVWTSSDVSVCAVSQQGRAIGVAPGRATVTALCGTVTGTAQVKVKPAPVERVVVEPGDVGIEVEEAQKLVATIYGPYDRKLAGRQVTWRSSVPAVLTVSADGTIEGVSPGTAAVIATCEGKEGLASISVRNQPVVAVRIQPARLQLEQGKSIQLQGTGEDRRGRPVAGRGLDWQSDDDRIALVDASGKVHAVSEGRTLVRAIADDATSSIEVVIVPRAAAQIRIEQHAQSLTVGDFLALDAAVLDADGATLQGRNVAWTSSDPAVLAISTTGECEAKKPGSVRITAACETAKAATKLSVRAPVVVPPPEPPRPAPTPEEATVRMPVLTPEVVAAREQAVKDAAAREVAARERMAAREAAQREPPTAPKPEPKQPAKRSMALPVGAGVVVLAAVGIYLATKGPSVASTIAGSETTTVAAPAPAPSDVDAALPSTKQAEPAAGTAAPPTKASAPPLAGRGQDAGLARGSQPSAGRGAADGSKVADSKSLPKAESKAPETKAADPPASAPPPVAKSEPPPTKGEPPPTKADPLPTKAEPPVTRADPPPTTTPAPGPDRAAEADRALVCGNADAASSLLSAALGADPAKQINALYRPRDAADARARDQLLARLKDAQGLKASVRTVRVENTAEGCDWIMGVNLTWRSFVGGGRDRAVQLRLQLEPAGGRARVKQIFGVTGQ